MSCNYSHTAVQGFTQFLGTISINQAISDMENSFIDTCVSVNRSAETVVSRVNNKWTY